MPIPTSMPSLRHYFLLFLYSSITRGCTSDTLVKTCPFFKKNLLVCYVSSNSRVFPSIHFFIIYLLKKPRHLTSRIFHNLDFASCALRVQQTFPVSSVPPANWRLCPEDGSASVSISLGSPWMVVCSFVEKYVT